MFYVHFYPHMPQNEAFWAKKRERVYRSLMPGAGGQARTDDLLFTKRRSIFFRICLALTLVIVGHHNAEPSPARSLSVYHTLPHLYVHFYPQIGGAA